jgi:hypothetical protein
VLALPPSRSSARGADSPWLSGSALDASLIADAPAVYRPRHPEQTAFYQLLAEHFEPFARVHEERYEPRDGPLRPVVRPTVEAFLDCGRLENGFARIRCPQCRAEHLLAFSCHTRNFCPSCQAKRAALFAEHLREKILAPVSHRHYVFTIPRALRGLFERERALLGLLARSAYEAVRKTVASALERKDAVPGFVGAIQTFGAFGPNFHPHVHAIVTEGAWSGGGEFLPCDAPDRSVIEEVFRREVLARLHRAERLSDAFLESLLSWTHSGFSVYAQQAIEAADSSRLERLARYATRPPIRLDAVEKTRRRQIRGLGRARSCSTLSTGCAR